MMRRRSVVWTCIGSMALMFALGACSATIAATPVPILTASSPATTCYYGRDAGTLAVDPIGGLGLQQPGGEVSHVRWPFGYTARSDGGSMVLVDPSGLIAARTGDQIAFAGGAGEGDRWNACEPITVLASPGP
jgi:hypothetical protein